VSASALPLNSKVYVAGHRGLVGGDFPGESDHLREHVPRLRSERALESQRHPFEVQLRGAGDFAFVERITFLFLPIAELRALPRHPLELNLPHGFLPRGGGCRRARSRGLDFLQRLLLLTFGALHLLLLDAAQGLQKLPEVHGRSILGLGAQSGRGEEEKSEGRSGQVHMGDVNGEQ